MGVMKSAYTGGGRATEFVSIQLSHDDKFRAMFAAMPGIVQQKIMRRALYQGCIPVREEIQRRATGLKYGTGILARHVRIVRINNGYYTVKPKSRLVLYPKDRSDHWAQGISRIHISARGRKVGSKRHAAFLAAQEKAIARAARLTGRSYSVGTGGEIGSNALRWVNPARYAVPLEYGHVISSRRVVAGFKALAKPQRKVEHEMYKAVLRRRGSYVPGSRIVTQSFHARKAEVVDIACGIIRQGVLDEFQRRMTGAR